VYGFFMYVGIALISALGLRGQTKAPTPHGRGFAYRG
jgi:hypothetical protein